MAILSNPHLFTSLLRINILPKGPVSLACLELGITNLGQAMEWMKRLPYGRNPDKQNLLTVFTDGCGTCSTKHALIKQLAMEQQVLHDLELFLGIFRMHAGNTPKVAHTLATNGLEYIPEAHCYLKWEDQIIDLTNGTSLPEDFAPDLLEEIEIQPDQITAYKVCWHKEYLERWRTESTLPISLDEIWAIREMCIADLSGQNRSYGDRCSI